MSEDIETKATALWVAAADAAVKGGAEPPEGDWDGANEDAKQYYRALPNGMEKARSAPPP
jgi:hypothetical protein